MGAQIGPQALAVELDHHECRNGEDGASYQRFAHRCRSARDVLLENTAAKRGNPKEGHGDYRGGNGGSDGLSGAHSEVRVGGAEYKSEEDPQADCLERHLGHQGLVVLQVSMVSGL